MAIIDRLLARYRSQPFIIQEKARFAILLGFAEVVIMAIGACYSGYLQLYFAPFNAVGVQVIHSAIALGLVATSLAMVLILRGAFSWGSHCLLLIGCTVVWSIIFGNDSPLLSRLTTSAYLIALLAAVPMIEHRRTAAIFFYALGNIGLTIAFFRYLPSNSSFEMGVVLDSFADIVIAMLSAAIIGYSALSVHLRALEQATREIAERSRMESLLRDQEERLNSLLDLSQRTSDLSEQEIIATALEDAVRLTESGIGYFHFVNSDQQTVELGVWSADTTRRCATVHDSHYPLAQAGVWADCARQRQPVIHNDYLSLPDKRGLPDNHIPVTRHLGVPVIEDDMVRVIAGVGNKASPYTQADVRQLQLIANEVWRMIQRKRAEIERLKLTAIIETSSDFISISDLDGVVSYLNEAGQRLVGISTSMAARGKRIREFIDPLDNDKLSEVLLPAIISQGSWVGEFRLKNFSTGQTIPIEMNAFLIDNTSSGEPFAFATIGRDITERKRAELNLIELAISDPLTGVFNRRQFFTLGHRAFEHAQQGHQHFSVLMIDADNFKSVNDRYGHAIGDLVLTEIVVRLRGALRDTDVIGRYGGEEFAIQMPTADLHVALQVAERLCEAVRKSPITTPQGGLGVSVSIGVATLEGQHDTTFDDLINRADQALYIAKQEGRDMVRAWRALSE